MAISMKIEIKNIDKLQKTLKHVQNGTEDYTVPMRQSGIYMERSIQQRFKNNNWKPLSPRTIKLHPRRAGGKPLLDTGKLRSSVTSQAIKHVTKTQLQYGTNLKYAPIHNFGGVTSWGSTIPQREFLYFSEDNERQIREIFTDYIKGLSN